MKKIIAVVGDSIVEENDIKYELSYNLGKALVDHGYRVQTGGLYGVMEAVLKGAKSSSKYQEGDTIAILPSFNKNEANEFADIIIPTGLDLMRNAIVVNADAVIAIGGGAGTLCEISYAWSLYKLIIGYNNVSGWSKKLAGEKIDKRERYKNTIDIVFPCQNENEAINILNEKIEIYTRCHNGIRGIIK